MRGTRRALLAVSLLVASAGSAAAACPVLPRGQPAPVEATVSPVPWPPWRAAVDRLTERLRRSDVSRVRLLFLGDSLTAGWQAQLFQQFYGGRAPLNLGIGGDATQGMLWRLDNGNWPSGLNPSTIVLLIGTNNLGLGARPEDVAIGISEVIAKLRRLAPRARILLLGLLPRGMAPTDPMRPLVARVNELVAPCADGRQVFFANPGPGLLDGAGILANTLSPDGLHLTPAGYDRFSSLLEASLRQVLRR